MNLTSGNPAQDAFMEAVDRAIPRVMMPQPKPDFKPVEDMVVMPKHYASLKIEPMRYAQENNFSPLQFNISKYVARYKLKNGMEDLKKARRCLDMLIDFEAGEAEWWLPPEARGKQDPRTPEDILIEIETDIRRAT